MRFLSLGNFIRWLYHCLYSDVSINILSMVLLIMEVEVQLHVLKITCTCRYNSVNHISPYILLNVNFMCIQLLQRKVLQIV